jgi:hypothetical protein
LTVVCNGAAAEFTGDLTLRLLPGIPQERFCLPAEFEEEWPSCILHFERGGDESPFDCDSLPGRIVQDVSSCLAAQAPEIRRVGFQVDSSQLLLISDRPFSIGICSDEIGLPCEEGWHIPLTRCPVYNLLDGVPGNEVHSILSFESGIGLRWLPFSCGDGLESTDLPDRARCDLNVDGRVDGQDLLLLQELRNTKLLAPFLLEFAREWSQP